MFNMLYPYEVGIGAVPGLIIPASVHALEVLSRATLEGGQR